MAARTPKIPERNTLLSSSLDGMDDLFDFKTKEETAQPQQGQETGGTGLLDTHKFTHTTQSYINRLKYTPKGKK